MNKMTWQYIVGFFDGEGCLCIRNRNNYKKGFYHWELSICQSIHQSKVIDDIKSFLDKQKIGSNIYCSSQKSHFGHFGKVEMKRLVIGKIREIKNFIDGVSPYMIVKKEKCEKFLNDYKEGKINKSATLSLRDIEKIKQLVKDGENTIKIGKEIGNSWETIRTFLIKNNIKWIRGKKKTGLWRICPICKLRFYVQLCFVKFKKRIFCSKKCYTNWQKGKGKNAKFNEFSS